MPEITQIIGTPLNALTFALAAILVGERLIKGGWFNFKIGKGENMSNIVLGEKMDTLSNYYNHETTPILLDIQSTMKEVNVSMQKVEQGINEIRINGVRIKN